jgi:predicted negative regulator of RcsB-dependent stress response
LWPGLEFANSSEPRRLSGDYLLNIADDAFRAAEETNNVIRNYRLVIAHATKPGKGDNARFRLARLLEEQGDFTQALTVLRSVQDTNASALRKRMAALEQRLNAKPAGN